jgi:autotransporter-associated beta strand protein
VANPSASAADLTLNPNAKVGYMGVLYKGFVGNESKLSLPVGKQDPLVTRTSVNGVDVLTPSGHGADGEIVGNYQVRYVNGGYTVLGAKDLLITVAPITSSYGSTPIYSYTAQYLAADGAPLTYLTGSGLSSTLVNLTTSGSTPFTLGDGNGTITMGLMPAGASLSSSGNTNAGQYNVTAIPGWTKTGNSFQNLAVVGASTIEPMRITTPTLTGASISKVYDGSAVVSSQVTNLLAGSSQLLAGDAAALSAIGTYDDKNVGSAKLVTIKFGIDGVDASNYVLSTNQIQGNYGAITQLASVTYVGPVGGDWSVASNWAGGAIPDLSNVANVIIPTGTSVSYGPGVAGPVTSQVAANGGLNLANAGGPVSFGGISGSGAIALGANTLTLTAAAGGDFSGVMSGTGGLTVAAGTQTLSGINTYTGNTAIDTGAILIIAGSGVLGGGNYAGSIANNGSLVYASSANQTLSGVISGSGSLTETAIPSGTTVGTLILSAANTYAGATVVDAGTLAITNAGALGSSSAGTTVNSGATLDLQNVTGVAEPITLNGGTLATSTGTSSVTAPVSLTANSIIDVDGTALTLSGTVSGVGGIDKTGAGTLTLSAANTYAGATVVDAGSLAITNAGALGSSSAGTTVNTGATLDLQNVTGVAEPITLNGGTLATSTGTSSVTAPVTLAANSTIAVTGTSLELTNAVSGSGGLTKTGSGILQLDAVNTYTGATTIDSGILKLGANASIADSSKVTVNGTLDMSAIAGNAYIQSLAGSPSGSVISGSVAPDSLVITNAGDTFSGTISGTGGLRIAGGTQTLTGINTYSGPTVVDPGANLIAGVQSIPGDIVNNGSFGFNQSTAGTFTHNMSGSGTMVIGGTGVITLTGTNTQAGGTIINSGASLIIGSADALSGDQVQSNNGSFGIANNIVLSKLDITGTVTLTTHITTSGAQSYDDIKIAPSSGNLIALKTTNSDITINGTLNATSWKQQSIEIDAGTGTVTLGDSVGNNLTARINMLTVTGSSILILADILTGDKQEYTGATSIGDGTDLGKSLVKGFLYDSHYQYFEYAQGGVTSTISAYHDDSRYVRTLVSKDPTVTFNGTVDDTVEYRHTLLVAAISANTASALAPSTMPIINFNDAVSKTTPLYSLNAQTVAALSSANAPDLSAYVGQINIAGNVTTRSNQVFTQPLCQR